MNKTPSSKRNVQDGLRNLHVKLISKVAIFTSLCASAVLLTLLFVISEEGQGNYLQIIQAHTITRQQLSSSMLIAVLLLLVIIGISVWLISLFSSFRIAGPLYRLSLNLQAALSFSSQQDIRHDDALQDIAQEVRDSAEHLKQHYQRLDELVKKIDSNLENQNIEAVNEAIFRLKEIESSVQLDD